MKKVCSVLAVLMSSLYLSSATAGVTVIDFDTDSKGNAIQNGQTVDTEYADYGVTISSVVNRGPNTQVAFDTTKVSVQDPDLEYYDRVDGTTPNYTYTALNIEGFKDRTNPGNVLIMQNADAQTGCGIASNCTTPNDENGRPAGYFEFKFDFLVDLISLDTFDFDENSLLTSQFFDKDDVEIVTGHTFTPMLDGQYLRQAMAVSGVKRLVLNLPGSGAIDNLVFKATDVPAPATLGIFGLSLLFMARRARK